MRSACIYLTFNLPYLLWSWSLNCHLIKKVTWSSRLHSFFLSTTHNDPEELCFSKPSSYCIQSVLERVLHIYNKISRYRNCISLKCLQKIHRIKNYKKFRCHIPVNVPWAYLPDQKLVVLEKLKNKKLNQLSFSSGITCRNFKFVACLQPYKLKHNHFPVEK